MAALQIKDVLSITYEALRIQSDRLQIVWEDDRMHLLRSFATAPSPSPSSSSRFSSTTAAAITAVTATVVGSSSSTRATIVDAKDDTGGSNIRELQRKLQLTYEDNTTLLQKNATLKQNFLLLEGKYRTLRAKVPKESDENAPSASRGISASTSSHFLLKRHRSEAVPRTVAAKATPSNSIVTTTSSAAGEGETVSGHQLRRTATAPLPRTSTTPTATYVGKYKEVVRKKADRAAMPGHTCEECGGFYQALLDQGLIDENQLRGHLQDCSRHKAKFAPEDTPPGFWDEDRFSMPTPEPEPPLAPPHAVAGWTVDKPVKDTNPKRARVSE